MKRSTIIVYAGVLCASLLGGYLTWTAEKKERPGKKETATIIECGTRDITSITLMAKNRTVEFTKNKSAVSGEPYWWVRIATTLVSPVAQPKTEATSGQETQDLKKSQQAGSEPAKKGDERADKKDTSSTQASGKETESTTAKDTEKVRPPRIEEFKANKTFGEQLEKLCPFMALRAFGTLGEEKLKEFGIIDSEEKLILGFKDSSKEFIFGTTSYGHRDRYVQEVGTNRVYLVAGQLIQDLTYPKSRFMERSLHQFDKDEVRRLQISTPEAQKDLLHIVQEEGAEKKDVWASSQAPDKAQEQYANWVGKLWQLSPIDYLPKTDVAAQPCQFPEGSAYVGSILFFSGTKELGFLKLYKGKDEKGEPEYYGCTEHTEAVVKLSKSQVDTVLKDLGDILEKD